MELISRSVKKGSVFPTVYVHNMLLVELTRLQSFYISLPDEPSKYTSDDEHLWRWSDNM
jgi:hypothetical protein